MQEKKHFKLFKAGKKWCTMAIATIAVVAGLAVTTTASADTTSTTDANQNSTLVNQPVSASQATSQTTASDNQSGQTANVDYQTPVNAGSLDSATATSQGEVEFSGWHATNDYKAGMHHFAIVLDGNGHELYRHETTTVNRPDVAAVYPHAPIAGQGGFTVDVPTSKLANTNSIRLLSRYTMDQTGNPAGGSDYWFPVITTKAGWLDQFQVTGNQVVVSGWHADDQAADKTEHTVILFDRTKNREVARAEHVKNVASLDLVKAGYGTVANGKNARYTVSFNLTPAMMGDELSVISRYSRPGQENTNYSDYWYNNTLKVNNKGNAGWLDNFSVDKTNNRINVSGWNANDNSAAEPVHEVILFDKTANKEVARQISPTVASPDVARAYGNINNAGHSRFTAHFDLTPAMLNHQLEIISRYALAGHDNDAGYYSDYVYGNQVLNLNTNKNGYLDTFYIDKANGKAVISGWGADDASMFMPTHFIILFDKTANREVAHQIVTNQASADVKNSNAGNIANAGNCRFNVTFNITPEMVGHQLTVLSRYSDSTKENDYGHYSDYWYNNTADFSVKQQAWLDTLALNAANHTITVAGWHADDASVYMPGHYIILFDKTANHEVAHKLVPVTASPDVANATHIANANKARFATTFDLTPAMLNHDLVVISRYSNSNDNNYGTATSDYWFNNNNINLDTQDGWLDNLSQSGNTINVSGWHTADSTLGLTHHIIILYDYTTGREVSRHEVTNTASGDLVASHGNYVNANNARFSTSFTVDPGSVHHAFGIISRYSNQADGEGTYSQYWMNNRYLNTYQNPGWMYQIQYSQIKANPAEVGHNIGPGYEGVKTWFINSKLGDANIHNQYTTGDAYAIMNIQRSHGLPATGWVDLPTWRALGYSDDLWYGIDSYVSPTLTNPGATRQQRIDAMINTAYRYMGKPWWAGCSSAPAWGVDCSGLVMQALYGAGINPTTVSSTHHGYPGNEWNSRNLFVDPHFQNVSWNDRQRGDLVFYYQPGTRTIWHVAILLDPNTVIESWPPSVMVQPILNGQRNVVAGIRRVFA
ncbi:NlpC/P60 family protein [Limosilactobacillus sp.]|uniref:NlpC/P60 family protein n=1 Tax=Limosilactobacillus sp. TaxID=2773925 RepID=UPI003F110CED